LFVKAVLFDLDGTLTDRPASINRYARRLHADLVSKLHEVEADAVAAVIQAADQRGYAPREDVFRALLQALPWHQAPELDLLQAHWDDWYPADTVASTGALSTLQALHAAGFLLGIVSNGTVKRQEPKIDVLGLRELLSVVVISEAAGVKKPDPKIFAAATRVLGCTNREAWFVGDHPANDVHGATQAGLRAIWLRGLHDWPSVLAPALYRVDKLSAVLGIVNRKLGPL
jgi:putative hydrolase of the HAD superfamily